MKNTIKIKTIIFILSLVIIGIICTGCTTPKDDEKVNNIIQQTKYLKVEKAGNWNEIYINVEDDRAYALSDEGKEWSIIRDKNVAQRYARDDGGEYIFKHKGYWELNYAIYYKAYFKGIKDLDLTVKDVKDSDYVIEIEDSEEIDRYLEMDESGFGVPQNPIGKLFIRITFDKQCRPIRVDSCVQTGDSEEDIIVGPDYAQKYSYNISKGEFNRGYKKIEKSLERIEAAEEENYEEVY